MDNRLKNIIIFEYKVDENGIPINNMAELSMAFGLAKEKIPKGMSLIPLPDTVKLKDIDEKDLSEINKNLLDDILKIMGDDEQC